MLAIILIIEVAIGTDTANIIIFPTIAIFEAMAFDLSLHISTANCVIYAIP